MLRLSALVAAIVLLPVATAVAAPTDTRLPGPVDRLIERSATILDGVDDVLVEAEALTDAGRPATADAQRARVDALRALRAPLRTYDRRVQAQLAALRRHADDTRDRRLDQLYARNVRTLKATAAGIDEAERQVQRGIARPPAVAARTARAAAPPAGKPTVVSLGDSYISGEAGRWAGNPDGVSQSARVDAGGPTAYFDNATRTGETIAGCHRSTSAEVHIGGPVDTVNLACSGAETRTEDGSVFKPGIDFYEKGGRRGQALALQELASRANVKLVVLSIGGNDFQFSSMVQTCLTDFLTSTFLKTKYCRNEPDVIANYDATALERVRLAIGDSIGHVTAAMTAAGYTADDWTLLVQNYPSPLPRGRDITYPESYNRQLDGGCGFWNTDADWADDVAFTTANRAIREAAATATGANVKTMDLSTALQSRRLCEKGTTQVGSKRQVKDWKDANAIDRVEWVQQIHTAGALFSDHFIQESMHPNHFGQMALRNCLRLAYNGGAPRGGRCTRIGPGTDPAHDGEPRMQLQ